LKADRCLWHAVCPRGAFTYFAKPLDAVNVSALNRFEDGAEVDAKALIDAGLLSQCRYGSRCRQRGT
jgi:large subunit ribosomal protein L15